MKNIFADTTVDSILVNIKTNIQKLKDLETANDKQKAAYNKQAEELTAKAAACAAEAIRASRVADKLSALID